MQYEKVYIVAKDWDDCHAIINGLNNELKSGVVSGLHWASEALFLPNMLEVRIFIIKNKDYSIKEVFYIPGYNENPEILQIAAALTEAGWPPDKWKSIEG